MVYREYSKFLQEKFNEKVYKLPIKIEGLTCPNRDGTLGKGGCIFCGEEGGSFENRCGSIKDQIEKNKALIEKKYKAKKFIAYFQNFTNTYMDFEKFKKSIEECLSEDIVGINISTRPDCLPEKYLEFLEKVNENYMVTLELGLQTPNYHTLKIINRGHGLSDFIDGVIRTKKHGLRIAVHLILNLPWDDELDTIEAAKLMNALNVDEVKLHALYILKNTVIGKLYQEGKIELINLEEYKKRVILFLRNLNKEIVVERIIGRAPKENSLFCNWNTSWWKIRDEIIEEMEENNYFQGDLRKGDYHD